MHPRASIPMTAPALETAPAPGDLGSILDLYSRGLCLQAYQAGQALGPLPHWPGTAARILAGRLAANLGAPRLASWLHVRAWRGDPANPEACYYFARHLLERRGPLAAWRFLRRAGELPEGGPGTRADWLSFHACVLGRL